MKGRVGRLKHLLYWIKKVVFLMKRNGQTSEGRLEVSTLSYPANNNIERNEGEGIWLWHHNQTLNWIKRVLFKLRVNPLTAWRVSPLNVGSSEAPDMFHPVRLSANCSNARNLTKKTVFCQNKKLLLATMCDVILMTSQTLSGVGQRIKGCYGQLLFYECVKDKGLSLFWHKFQWWCWNLLSEKYWKFVNSCSCQCVLK